MGKIEDAQLRIQSARKQLEQAERDLKEAQSDKWTLLENRFYGTRLRWYDDHDCHIAVIEQSNYGIWSTIDEIYGLGFKVGYTAIKNERLEVGFKPIN